MAKETWKDVKGFEGLYEVSDLGRIRSLGRVVPSKNGSTQKKRVRILTQEVTVDGYCRIRLYDKNGKSWHYQVHRIVMEAFVGHSDLQVNHKNEIKSDNRVVNLEYLTPKANCNYGKRNEKISEKMIGVNSRGVVQMKKDGGIITTFPSRMDAAEKTKVNATNIGRCCAGLRKSAGGFLWRNE